MRYGTMPLGTLRIEGEARRSNPAVLLFGTNDSRKLPRFDCRIELCLLRFYIGLLAYTNGGNICVGE
jgi:hypothetical protein